MIVALYIGLVIITIIAIIFCALFLGVAKKLRNAAQTSTQILHEKEILIAEASTKIDFYKSEILQLDEVKNYLEQQIKELEIKINHAETQKQLVQQQNESLQAQMADFEETKRKHLEASKASMLEISAQLSNKLLEDHKRETNQIKKEFEENFKKTSTEFGQNYQTVFEAVKTLNDQIKETKTSAEFVKNALLSPTVGGSLAEITLENILVSAGLIEGTDFTMQASFAVTGGARRPDAVIYLPAGGVLAVDAKTSIFFAQAANSQTEDEKQKHEADLKAAVNEQLRSLIHRDYKKAIIESYQAKDKPDENNVTIIMFLPTEAAIEKMQALDKNFIEKAWKEKIFPVGPSGLMNILVQSKLMIDRTKQEKNYEVILQEVKKLLDSVATIQAYAVGMGKGLESTVKKYNEFAGGFNKNLTARARKISELGLKDTKDSAFDSIPKLIVQVEE